MLNPEENKVDESTVEEVEEKEMTQKVQAEVEEISEANPENELATQLTEAQAKIDQLEDQVLRLNAEIANMQRSHARDRQESAKFRSQSLAQKLIEALDNLERALETPAQSEETQAFHKGVEMVYQQIIAAFEAENITKIDPMGQAFDPNFHQAVTTQPAEEGQDSDIVVNVLQKGYVLNDRVIRPAMVIVSQ